MTKLEELIAYLIDEMKESHRLEVPKSIFEQRKMLRILMNVRHPSPIPKYILSAQDSELSQQLKEKGTISLQEIPVSKLDQRLKLWKGDITRLEIDVVVNAANNRLLGCFSPLHACIDNAIHSAAGMQLRQACYELMQEQGGLEPTGTAKITSAYNLPSKYVIHTVGPIVRGRIPTPEDERLLWSCYDAVLKIAHENLLQSVAFCCISTGEFGFPQQRAAEIAVLSVIEFLNNQRASSVQTVVFNVFKDEDLKIYEKLLY